MTGRAKNLLSDATQDELLSCIRLLAMNVAQHRQNADFINLRDSAEYLKPQNSSKEKVALFMKSRDIVEDALEVVRVLAAEAPPKQDVSETEEQIEKRKQLRINISVPIRLILPGAQRPSNATLHNISWGGASIIVDQLPAQSGGPIQVLLPGIKSPALKLEAKLLRSWALSSSEGEGMAVRFSSIATKDQDEFEEILKRYAASGDNGGLREYARLAQHLDIQFDGPDELQATLDDISAGGLGVTVPDPLQIGQSLESQISTVNGDFSLKLRARVVRLEPIKMGKVMLYHAGLKFEHPPRELTALTRDLIAKMAKG